jgi:hypothetical protein
VSARPLGEADATPAQIGWPRIFPSRFTRIAELSGLDEDNRKVDKRDICGLCKKRRLVACVSEVYAAGIECLKKRRPGRKLDPLDVYAFGLESRGQFT